MQLPSVVKQKKTVFAKCKDLAKTRGFLVFCVTFVFLNVMAYHSSQMTSLEMYQEQTARPLVVKFGEKFWINKTERKILLWTKFFLEKNWVKILQNHFKTYGCNCIVTGNREEIRTADAVVFHALDMWFWEKLPEYRTKEQIWIIFVAEPPPHIHYTGMKWKFPRYIFNWTFSYRRDSTVYAPYGRFQVKENPGNEVFDIAKTKTKMTVSMMGNCFDDARRYRYLHELSKYTQVDFYGRCGNMTCPRTKLCDKILEPYRFKVAFENSHCKDYVSEKFWNSLYNNRIPIVNWRKEQKLPFAPPKAFINVFDFKSMKDLGEYLNYLAKNETEYNSYFQWRNTFRIEGGDVIWHMFCTLCKRLKQNPLEAQVVDYLAWMESDTCKTWSVSRMIQRRIDRWRFDGKLVARD